MFERLKLLDKNTGKTINLDITVDELAEIWLKNVKNRVRANSYERYTLNTTKIIEYYTKNNFKVVNYTRADAKVFFNLLYAPAFEHITFS